MACSICGGNFAKFYSNLDRFRSNGDRQGWLEKIAVYLCNDCNKRMKLFITSSRIAHENGTRFDSVEIFSKIHMEFNSNIDNVAWLVFSKMAEDLA